MNQMRLSDQALGAIMMALQKSILDQTDIVPVLQSFILTNEGGMLTVQNPPAFQIKNTVHTDDKSESV